MAIHTTCRSCGGSFEMPAQGTGAKGACPHCGVACDLPEGRPVGEGAAVKLALSDKPLQSKPVIDRSRPPVLRKPVVVPPPVSPDSAVPPGPPAPPSGTPEPEIAPTEGAPPVSFGTMIPDIPRIADIPLPDTGIPAPYAGMGGKPARPHKPPNVPAWAWVAVAGAGLIVGVLGLYAWHISTAAAVKGLATPIVKQPGLPAGKVEAPPEPVAAGKMQVANSLEDVPKGVVKLQMPTAEGAGFLINSRGWIATNHHVASRMTTAARAVVWTGAKYELAGIIADDPRHDLAIVKLAEKPEQLMVILDISYRDKPRLDQDVRALGHPEGLGYSLSKGVVSRVQTTSEIAESNPRIGDWNFPPDMTWIQHDAAIAHGNSGGPLLDAKGKVLGINTFGIPGLERYGFASHIKYLRELAESATERLTPLPAAEAAPQPAPVAGEPQAEPIQVSPDRMLELYTAWVALRAKPAEAKQYDTLAELAKIMTAAKHTKLHPSGRETISPEELEAAVKRGDELFGRIGKAEFNAERVKAINDFAAGQINKVGAGVMLFGIVAGGGPNFLVLKVEGTEKLLLVPVAAEIAQSARGSRCMAMGIMLGTEEIRDDQGNKVAIPLLLSHYVLPLK